MHIRLIRKVMITKCKATTVGMILISSRGILNEMTLRWAGYARITHVRVAHSI